MSTLDALIDTGLYYGPGVLLTAAVIAAGHGFVWAADRTHRLIEDRAARRECAAIAARWRQVENNANAFIAEAGDQLADRVLQQIHTNETDKGEK